MWARFPLLPEPECGGTLGRCCPRFTVQRLDTQPQGPLRCTVRSPNQLCATGRCVAELFPQGLPLQTPSPLSVSPLSVESRKDTQDLDLNRQSLPKRKTLCDQKMVQKSQFSFKGARRLLCKVAEDQPAAWLKKIVAAQATRWSTTKQRRGQSQLSSGF